MLSDRARENNAWFLKQFARQLNRQGSKSKSRIDLATAENCLIRPNILEILRNNCWNCLGSNDLSYASGLGGPPKLLAALAKFYNCFFSPNVPVEPEHLVVGSGCSSILDTLINDICDYGDGLLVEAPMWGSFEISAVLRNGVKIIPVHVALHDDESPQAVLSGYQQAVQNSTCRVRGILFCNPHNPKGYIYRPEVIDALLQYCEEMDLHFISDEVYGLSNFGTDHLIHKHDASPTSTTGIFSSVLERDLKILSVDPSRVHQVYSLSKDFGSSGLRLGCLVTQGNKDLRLSQAILNNAKICNAVAVMFTPLLQDLTMMRRLVETNKYNLRKAARIVVQFAKFHSLEFFPPTAGLYIWVRLLSHCTTFAEEELAIQRCTQHGVSIGGGADYAELRPGWFRLVFSVSQPDLLMGLRRIEAALGFETQFENTATLSPGSGWFHWIKLQKFHLSRVAHINRGLFSGLG